MLLGQTSSTNKQANQRNDSKHHFSYDGAYPVGPTQYAEVVFYAGGAEDSRGAEEAAFGTFEASQRADWEGPASLKVLDHQKI